MSRAMQALALGHKGEQYVYSIMEQLGLGPVFSGPGDILLASGVAIEVKASTLGTGKRKRYSFCLWRKIGQVVKTDHRKSDLVVLLAYADLDKSPILFCVPSHKLKCKTLKMPANLNAYAGWIAWYRNFDRAIYELDGGLL